MSVYRPKNKNGTYRSEIYLYDFWITLPGAAEPTRQTGSTGQKTKAGAQKYEAKVRELASLGLLTSLMTLEKATNRYLEEVAIDAPSDHAYRQQKFCMEELVRYYGADTLLTMIGPNEVATAAALRAKTPLVKLKRLGAFVRKRDRPQDFAFEYAWKSTGKFPTAAAINRQVIEPMRRLLRRAKKQWKVPIDLEQFQWGGRDGIKRNEPDGRAREMSASEERVFWKYLPVSYHNICELYIISGKRQSIWLDLKKENVNLHDRKITYRLLKKRQVIFVTADLTDREFEIVYEAYMSSPDDTDYVFTAPSDRVQEHGALRRITSRMLRWHINKACEAAGIKDFKPHDFRHTFGSRLMRETKDLRLTQKAMEHSSITSTLRYVHVLQNDVTDARARVKVSKGGERTQGGTRPVPKRKRIA